MIFKKINATLKYVTESINVITMITLTLALFTGVIARYVFSYSIPEIEVIRKFCIMWLVFMGSAIAIKEKQHLEIDIFTEYLSKRLAKIKEVIVYILTLAGVIILLFIGLAAFDAGLNRTELVSISFLPFRPSLTYYYSAFLIGSIFMLYFHLLNFKDIWRDGPNEVNKE
ncbi:TRAP transporter small permease [Alkalicoccus daliensis]|uniref:TRAP-type C4-dicarboxylate transport system, small permease component n=1 Tax=Alkalicoccus daliensis TaxID=745820 RepID=A0A1H0EXG1_9BACI|nr:TRAP transporter small permease subunit [Alkalicoccus daliensis]SDN87035.1 TRAP-type C4-dicarboxylate transport system, small permease component [Alkalicoccus daliensis]